MTPKPTDGHPWAFLDYELPAHLIAQFPCEVRDQARLLVVRRSDASLAHHTFVELPSLLEPDDLLVLNDTSVVPARLLGKRTRTGGRWEGLFLRSLPDDTWEILSQTRGWLLEGEELTINPGPLTLRLLEKSAAGHWRVQPSEPGGWMELMARHGHMPLPPYIRKGRALPADRVRYQTVYARSAGAVAAPTAGLHFTQRLLDRLRQRDIEIAYVTLHVGLGTFQPIQAADVTMHHMHSEWGELPQSTVEAIGRCRERGGRVIAVGTTSARVLETVAATGTIGPWSGDTDLYIYPPYRFGVVDALLTNFHVPRSTLLLLVGALAGVELIQQAYQTAIDESYRFYSYGDAMLIL